MASFLIALGSKNGPKQRSTLQHYKAVKGYSGKRKEKCGKKTRKFPCREVTCYHEFLHISVFKN